MFWSSAVGRWKTSKCRITTFGLGYTWEILRRRKMFPRPRTKEMLLLEPPCYAVEIFNEFLLTVKRLENFWETFHLLSFSIHVHDCTIKVIGHHTFIFCLPISTATIGWYILRITPLWRGNCIPLPPRLPMSVAST